MEYSVEDVSKLAKVSVRTIHYYDEIDLLKPSIRKVNGRRYYNEEKFLRLMDIIFFKKLGFNLSKIKSILNLGNKDKRFLMMAKKDFLEKEIKRMKDLIKSIDAFLKISFKGENLNYNQIIKQFEQFQRTAKEDKDSFVKEFGSLIDGDMKKLSLEQQKQNYEKLIIDVDMEKYSKKMNAFFKQIIKAIEENKKEDSKEV